MRHYKAKSLEFTKEGFTDLFIFSTSNLPATVGGPPVNDFSVGFSAQQLLCTALNASDCVMYALIDVKTAIVGPTGAPTGQIKTSSGGVAITPTATLASGLGSVTNNTVVGRTISAGTENLVLDLEVGGGNGAAATAGEVWVWVNIARAGRLNISA